ncbi:MAG: circadian clock protein KaiC [Kiritimatiellia bacterium]
MKKKHTVRAIPKLRKCPTGITGLDEVTCGGLPRGRVSLVCGGAGSGKTLLAMEFIVRGITQFNEPGAFMSFEETAEDLAVNVSSLGFDVNGLIGQNKMAIDHVHLERGEMEESGEYNLEGLFVRLDMMIRQVGAKRVVLDAIDVLFACLTNEGILRSELQRLFLWLKKKGVTAIITGEQGQKSLSRHGIEEYISDCVIFLDHRIHNQISTRRLRVVKYRGSQHGTNEYPTLIDETGLSVLPISSAGLSYTVSSKRVSTGIPRLDAMLDGKGYYRGSTILMSGTPGTGKTSLACAFAESICRDGGKFLLVSFEEPADQIIRNMRSIGINLEKWRTTGQLKFHTVRPTLYGLEMHLATLHKLVNEFKPDAMAIDSITDLTPTSEQPEARLMLIRLIDYLKNMGITSLFTFLTWFGDPLGQNDINISSLMDTWILIRILESRNERNRLLFVLKSRGMAHSNQMREVHLSSDGIQLVDVYVGPDEVLTGSARLVQEASDEAKTVASQQTAERRQRELDQEQSSLRGQADLIAKRRAGIRAELNIAKNQAGERQKITYRGRRQIALARKAD